MCWEGDTARIDRAVLLWLNRQATLWLDRAAVEISTLGDTLVIAYPSGHATMTMVTLVTVVITD